MEYVNYRHVDGKSDFLNRRKKMIINENLEIDILQIGDSIIQNFNINRYIPTRKSVINSGTGGEVSKLMLKRLKCDGLDLNTKLIIIHIGINDILQYYEGIHYGENKKIKSDNELISTVSYNIIKSVEICLETPVKVVWCKILPINKEHIESHYLNQIINKVNEKVESKISYLNNVEIINYDCMTCFDGRLDNILSFDGVHLNDDGYFRMADKLIHHLK